MSETIHLSIWVVWNITLQSAVYFYTDTDDIPDEFWDKNKYKITKESLNGTIDYTDNPGISK